MPPTTRREVLAHMGSSALTLMVGQSSQKAEPLARPPLQAIALHRLAFGPRPGEVEALKLIGLEKWVQQQVKPTADDPEVDKRLAELKLEIRYEHEGKKVEEQRPLTRLNATRDQLWKLTAEGTPYEEKVRCVYEVMAATYLRAVYSKWQLREVLVDFWHNHFNVNMWADDDAVRILFPLYDREVIRKHCFGNFRQFLEAVATSGPMLVYLNNSRSKASPANENYARELFELHTMGAPNYLNHLYNKWREVPGATEGKAQGYIDQDVYEAARAFTGWTLANGAWTERDDSRFPNTGDFHYYEPWHDNYQKRILGVEFEPNQPPMADGRKVLDLVANHAGTARFVCGKLIRRLVGDEVPSSLLDRAVKVWMANLSSSDQIGQVVATIATSPEFAATWGQKIKRPMEVAASFIRGTGMEFTPNLGLFWLMASMGQRTFSYPFPTGHPDTREYWLGTFNWIQRWNLPGGLMWEGSKMLKPETPKVPQGANSWESAAQAIVLEMLGYSLPTPVMTGLLAMFREGRDQDAFDPNDQDLHWRIRRLQMAVAMTPEFHAR